MEQHPTVEFVGEEEAAELAEIEYLTSTGCPRFDFQRGACRHSEGIILHIGCNEDPAKLKRLFGGRIINCDRTDWDETMQRPNLVDKVFDWSKPWPFSNDSAELVVLNDVLTFSVDSSVAVLREAHRVASRVAFSLPESADMDRPHEEEKLRHILIKSGWKPFVVMIADWMTDPPQQGWLVEAHRI